MASASSSARLSTRRSRRRGWSIGHMIAAGPRPEPRGYAGGGPHGPPPEPAATPPGAAAGTVGRAGLLRRFPLAECEALVAEQERGAGSLDARDLEVAGEPLALPDHEGLAVDRDLGDRLAVPSEHIDQLDVAPTHRHRAAVLV